MKTRSLSVAPPSGTLNSASVRDGCHSSRGRSSFLQGHGGHDAAPARAIIVIRVVVVPISVVETVRNHEGPRDEDQGHGDHGEPQGVGHDVGVWYRSDEDHHANKAATTSQVAHDHYGGGSGLRPERLGTHVDHEEDAREHRHTECDRLHGPHGVEGVCFIL